MTRYAATWLNSAQMHLAQIWNDATDKQAVTRAANAIDVELATDADRKGNPVPEGLRSLSIPPLHVLFEVQEQDRLVEVASIRADPPPSSSTEKNGAPLQ
jgi:hypothetical protein